MSVTVDVNVLVHAVNEDAREHAEARALVERLGAGPAIVHLFWPTLMGFLRICTHPRILPAPISFRAASEVVDSLLELPHVRTSSESEEFWGVYQETAGRGVRGNLVPDAHLVALMREHGVGVIHTLDRGFRRFEGIEVRGLTDG